MDPTMHHEFVELGVAARVAGRAQSDNPMLADGAAPACNSDEFASWSAKLLAWDQGWKTGSISRT